MNDYTLLACEPMMFNIKPQQFNGAGPWDEDRREVGKASLSPPRGMLGTGETGISGERFHRLRDVAGLIDSHRARGPRIGRSAGIRFVR